MTSDYQKELLAREVALRREILVTPDGPKVDLYVKLGRVVRALKEYDPSDEEIDERDEKAK